MRALTLVLLTLALVTHTGVTGVPAPRSGCNSLAGAAVQQGPSPGHVSAAATQDVLPAEVTSEGLEWSGGGGTRAEPSAPDDPRSSVAPSGTRCALPTRVAPSSLLGFQGHPTTAPPHRN